MDRQQYASQLDELIQQLYSYEQPNGMWPYPFDKNAKPSDFISYHAVLALALAGRRPETDSNLKRAVDSHVEGATAGRKLGRRSGLPRFQHAFPRDPVCGHGAFDSLSRARPESVRGKGLG